MANLSRFLGLASVFRSTLTALLVLTGRALRATARWLRDFVLISGSFPSMVRDPGIAAFCALEASPRRARPFRGGGGQLAVSGLARVSDEPHLQLSVGL